MATLALVDVVSLTRLELWAALAEIIIEAVREIKRF